MLDARDYGIVIRRQVIDGERVFVATVEELRHVRYLADTPEDAYRGTLEAVGALIDSAKEDGRPFPSPEG